MAKRPNDQEPSFLAEDAAPVDGPSSSLIPVRLDDWGVGTEPPPPRGNRVGRTLALVAAIGGGLALSFWLGSRARTGETVPIAAPAPSPVFPAPPREAAPLPATPASVAPEILHVAPETPALTAKPKDVPAANVEGPRPEPARPGSAVVVPVETRPPTAARRNKKAARRGDDHAPPTVSFPDP